MPTKRRLCCNSKMNIAIVSAAWIAPSGEEFFSKPYLSNKDEIMSTIDSYKFLIESTLFGVCERIGDRLKMPAKDIRLFFIYASCLTIGSPIILYMILAFWIGMK